MGDGLAAPLVVALASEVLQARTRPLDLPATPGTRYLILLDISEQAIPMVFSALDLRRPDQRVHLTRDAGSIHRLLIASARPEPSLGLVDAFVAGDSLHLVTGDFNFRSFPLARVPRIGEIPARDRGSFEIHEAGSYLYWPARDFHLGVSQILQEADPMYLADVAIERNLRDYTGATLRSLREEKGLRQSDVPGLGERQVRRIEEGISRLRAASAEKFALAFGMELKELLDELAVRAGRIRRDGASRARTQVAGKR